VTGRRHRCSETGGKAAPRGAPPDSVGIADPRCTQIPSVPSLPAWTPACQIRAARLSAAIRPKDAECTSPTRGGTTRPLLTWSRTFRATPAQIPEARKFLRTALNGCPVADDAILCVSELATNSVLHSDSGKAGGTFTVRADIRQGDYTWIEVEDNGGPWVTPARHDDRPHGLDIVDALTSAWGIDGDPLTGWVARARLDWPTPSPPPSTADPAQRRAAATTNPGQALTSLRDALAAQGITTTGITLTRRAGKLHPAQGPAIAYHSGLYWWPVRRLQIPGGTRSTSPAGQREHTGRGTRPPGLLCVQRGEQDAQQVGQDAPVSRAEAVQQLVLADHQVGEGLVGPLLAFGSECDQDPAAVLRIWPPVDQSRVRQPVDPVGHGPRRDERGPEQCAWRQLVGRPLPAQCRQHVEPPGLEAVAGEGGPAGPVQMPREPGDAAEHLQRLDVQIRPLRMPGADEIVDLVAEPGGRAGARSRWCAPSTRGLRHARSISLDIKSVIPVKRCQIIYLDIKRVWRP
jgi:serine/threonine-protein kinase RsbW